MWHIVRKKMEEEVVRDGSFDSETLLDKMDISMHQQQYHPVCPGTLKKEECSTITPASELMNEAVQAFRLEPKIKSQYGSQQNFTEFAHSQGVPKEKMVTPPVQLFRQESEVVIDRRWHGKKIVPPDVSASEAPRPSCVQHLGVTRKIAQKRMRDDEEERDETDKAPEKSSVDFKIGFKQPVKLDQSCSPGTNFGLAQTRDAACHLINKINKASLSHSTQSLAPKKVLVDQSLDWSDLDVPLHKELVGRGTFGEVTSLLISKGRKIIQKDLTPDQQKAVPLIHINEMQVPLSFPNCSFITRVLGIIWDGQKASILQEHAGLSLREAMQNPQHSLYLQQKGNTRKIMLELFKAVEILHIHGIKHRDLKPENCCWDPLSGQVRLIDFASSCTPQDKQEASLTGITPEYLPPVVSNNLITKRCGTVLSEKDDVWGAAMVGLYIIKEGHPVIWHFAQMPEYPPSTDQMKIRLNTVLFKLAQLGDPLPHFFLNHPDRPVMEELLRGCLAVNEKKRWTAQEAVKFLQGKLNSDGSPARKYRKLGNPSNLERVLSKANPSGNIDDVDLSQNLNIRAVKTQETGSGLNRAAGPSNIMGMGGFHWKPPAGQFPLRSQLVTALTPRAQPLVPRKLSHAAQPFPPQVEEPETEDEEHLKWLKETCGVKKPAPLPQHLLNLKMKLATQENGQAAAQGKSAYSFGGYGSSVAGSSISFGTTTNFSTVGRNAAASTPVAPPSSGRQEYNGLEKRSNKVLSPLPDTALPWVNLRTPAPAEGKKPLVVGMWGKLSPQHTPEMIDGSETQCEEEGDFILNTQGKPQGNIPLFLFETSEK